MDKLKELLSRCKCGVFLRVNEHRGYYQTVEQFLDEAKGNECPPEIKAAVVARMIETNTIVCLQFYPETPIGCYEIWHFDVEWVIEEALDWLGQNE